MPADPLKEDTSKITTIALGNLRIEIYMPVFERTVFVMCMIISNSLLVNLVNKIYLKIEFVVVDFFYAMLVYPLFFLAPALFAFSIWRFVKSKFDFNSFSFTSILLLILAAMIEIISVA